MKREHADKLFDQLVEAGQKPVLEALEHHATQPASEHGYAVEIRYHNINRVGLDKLNELAGQVEGLEALWLYPAGALIAVRFS